jgi:hypothetical protein
MIFADAPATWEDPDHGSGLELLLILGGVPLAIILLIALFTYLPSMMRGTSTEPALAFQQKPEWFGGPRRGTDAVDGQPEAATESPSTGGGSARW